MYCIVTRYKTVIEYTFQLSHSCTPRTKYNDYLIELLSIAIYTNWMK